jgi:uncharacterized membrane protein
VFAPNSPVLLGIAVAAALAITGLTAVVWDRRGWVVVRFAGPLTSTVLFSVAALVAINLIASLFDTWSDVWGFVR